MATLELLKTVPIKLSISQKSATLYSMTENLQFLCQKSKDSLHLVFLAL